MEIKQFNLTELKATDDDTRTVEGFASIFGNVDSHNEIVVSGAFAKSIKKRTPAMLYQHKSDSVIGIWDEVKEKEEGLFVKGRIIDTTLGNDAYKLVKLGALKGMSIGYVTGKHEIDNKKGTRKLLEVDLFEVSLVTFPSNAKAQVTGIKSRPESERELEQYLRDAGYSNREAKAIISGGYKAISGQRDAEKDALILSKLNNAINILRG